MRRSPFAGHGLVLASALGALLSTAALAGPINAVSYDSLTGTQVVDLSIFPDGNYDQVMVSGGVSFAERFAGQTLSILTAKPPGVADVGYWDQLDTSATSPLSLQVGLPGQNASAWYTNNAFGDGVRVNTIMGLGSATGTIWEREGEGSLAVLFEKDQSRFGFTEIGGNGSAAPNGGSVYLSFFRRDGSLIGSMSTGSVSMYGSFGYQRDGGVADIAGVSMYNDDQFGLGYYNLLYDVSPVPEPASAALLLAGVCGLALVCWGRAFR